MAKKTAVKPVPVINSEVGTALEISPEIVSLSPSPDIAPSGEGTVFNTETVSDSPFIGDTVSASPSDDSLTSEGETILSSGDDLMSGELGGLGVTAAAQEGEDSTTLNGERHTPSLPSFPVLSPLKFDGKKYGIGEEVAMFEKEAKALQDIGILGGMIE